MSYTPYATQNDYKDLFGSSAKISDSALISASRHVDTLTFNRIVSEGFDNLTSFQQEIIKEVTCRQAKFEAENEDLISSMLSSYSINGVSMSFGEGWNVTVENGVAMQRETYAMLRQTGLCCRIL